MLWVRTAPVADHRPARRSRTSVWPKARVIVSEVKVLSALPQATTVPPARTRACVVVAGSSSRWWVTSTDASSGRSCRQ